MILVGFCWRIWVFRSAWGYSHGFGVRVVGRRMLVRRPVLVLLVGMFRSRFLCRGMRGSLGYSRCICLFLLVLVLVALSMQLYMSRLHPAVRPRMLSGLPSLATRYFSDFVMVIR